MGERSKTMPAEVFIGGGPKRSQPVRPPNHSALNRRPAARAGAVKREASAPAEDRRTRARGRAANAELAASAARGGAKSKNPRFYADKQGNVKAKRPAKYNAKSAKSAKKSVASFSPEAVGARPEDRYGVRRRPPARGKSLAAVSASRSRERRVGLVA